MITKPDKKIHDFFSYKMFKIDKPHFRIPVKNSIKYYLFCHFLLPNKKSLKISMKYYLNTKKIKWNWKRTQKTIKWSTQI